ncbi:hypothetical protein QWM81_04410 [Streptomyces ficellus]|uniref:Uncharacterized protein n=1 Tax=Streptomyces ficellus TaxID=1977088 RepID=A0ABT7Z1D3_9ACTN|nr:hypothetical protein [Streptomyces ficellus]MDN3293303.1 hypothetical protein [Streptomyces ficellus]
MARDPRFHLDQDGHSVTVQLYGRSGGLEVLVDGKVVAYERDWRRGGTVPAELPGDPPRPFSITVSSAKEMGGVPFCVMETGGTRYLMPRVPLGGSRYEPARPGPYLGLRRLRRFLRRLVRRWARR